MKKLLIVLLSLCLFQISCNLLDAADEVIVDISGKVTENDDAVESVIVLLLESTDISDGLSLANGSITNSNGKYTIFKVDPGDYYVAAVEDQNDNLEFDVDTDRIGFYGVNINTLDLDPIQITVDKDDLENIDIDDLYSITGK